MPEEDKGKGVSEMWKNKKKSKKSLLFFNKINFIVELEILSTLKMKKPTDKINRKTFKESNSRDIPQFPQDLLLRYYFFIGINNRIRTEKNTFLKI